MENKNKKILDFLEEIDSLKSIERKGYLKDYSRHDNPAEHSWHMMVMAVLLNHISKEKLDLEKILLMSLFHDIHEIYTGDTPKYDEKSRTEIKKKEKEAAHKLFSALPKDLSDRLMKLWQEFEDNKTPEAKFANHCDYLQGFSQSYFARGKSWNEMGITKEKTQQYTIPIAKHDTELSKFISVLYDEIDKKKLLK